MQKGWTALAPLPRRKFSVQFIFTFRNLQFIKLQLLLRKGTSANSPSLTHQILFW
jgi:hypothetical protein